ncbi:MAG: class I SAM-dependent methyltransferase [Candidatus Daviesbacteria bacterium]|nr:class I SAM-dependent methyltransferase [Candidatus Daviesbacteria bacterium]
MQTEQLNEINNLAYQQIAVDFNRTTIRSPLVEDYLKQMVEGLSKEDLVLDIGCGPGYYVNFLDQFVHAVGIDVSPDFIDVAKKEYPGKEFELGDMRHLKFANNFISGISAIASLLHIPKAEAPAVLIEFKRVLKSGSKVVFLMKIPDVNYSGDGFEIRVRSGKEVKRYFARYSQEEFDQLLSENSFAAIRSEVIHLIPEDPEPWLLYLTEVKNG